jgi:hypothetical protein
MSLARRAPLQVLRREPAHFLRDEPVQNVLREESSKSGFDQVLGESPQIVPGQRDRRSDIAVPVAAPPAPTAAGRTAMMAATATMTPAATAAVGVSVRGYGHREQANGQRGRHKGLSRRRVHPWPLSHRNVVPTSVPGNNTSLSTAWFIPSICIRLCTRQAVDCQCPGSSAQSSPHPEADRSVT